MAELAATRPLQLLEALLFVAGEPVTLARLARALAVEADELTILLDRLATNLEARGLRLLRHADTAQLVTAPELATEVEAFLGLPMVQRLSHAALEALAVVAYQQPVTRAQVEAVRGVDSGAVLTTLLARGLIEEVGRLPTPGHPFQLGTTPEFLRLFGLGSLDELPALTASDGTPLAEVWERRRAERSAPPAATND